MDKSEFSGWHNGSGTFGLKVLGGLEERDRFLPWRDKLEREGLDVLPGKAGDVLVEGVSETPSFWKNCPEFRDSDSVPDATASVTSRALGDVVVREADGGVAPVVTECCDCSPG